MQGVASLGPRFDEQVLAATRELYEPQVRLLPDVKEHRDLAYGPHERHRLDLFTHGGNGLPMLLFVHGGGFVAGDKRGTPMFYANVGHYFAQRGLLVATMNYRLAPGHAWPAGQQDVAAAVEWLVAHAAEHGGDPQRLVLLAQSAGAAHAAGYLMDPGPETRAVPGVRAAALMSGFYQARAPLSPGAQAYFGTDETQYPVRSPANHAAHCTVPLLLTVAEYDPAPIARQTLELASALTAARGACPPLEWLNGHNHVSPLMSLGTPQAGIGELLAEFFFRTLARD